jgi:hypothetical protein
MQRRKSLSMQAGPEPARILTGLFGDSRGSDATLKAAVRILVCAGVFGSIFRLVKICFLQKRSS